MTVDHEKIKQALDQSIEETRRYLRAEGAAAERASIVAALLEPSDELIEAAMRAAGTPDEVLSNQDACNEMRAAIKSVGRFVGCGEHAQPEPAKRDAE